MSELADTQEALLLQLKQKGPQTAKTLAQYQGITTMGVRQHLAALEERGLVKEGAEQKGGRGRPVKPWMLTEKAQSRFPDAHAQVSVELIAAVRDTFGDTGLDQLIEKRTRQGEALYRAELAKLSSLSGKIKRLAELRSKEGYMASFEKIEPGQWLLLENHCPICAAANACQGFCRSELAVFQSAFGAGVSVERTEHILEGARRCAYMICEK